MKNNTDVSKSIKVHSCKVEMIMLPAAIRTAMIQEIVVADMTNTATDNAPI